jgi:alkylation response protein AidB-like acyl-CoA dehydrogenase
VAGVLVEMNEDGGLWWVAASEPPRPLDTLAGEPWATGTFTRRGRLDVPDGQLAASVELTRAAWTVGAGEALVALAADHAAARRQFGRPVGDFQGVAHPLAEAEAEVGAARDLVRLAAFRLDRDGETRLAAAAALAATRAGLRAAYTSHQAHGALGFTTERGLDRWSTGIRQLSLHPPSPARTVEAVLG